LEGFVGKDPATPDQNGIDGVYIYVLWEKDSKLILVGQTDAGYIQKVWVPFHDADQFYVLVSYEGNLVDLYPNSMPPMTEFDPDYYTWFHNKGEETAKVTFFQDQ
jgi:hypothetical protein